MAPHGKEKRMTSKNSRRLLLIKKEDKVKLEKAKKEDVVKKILICTPNDKTDN